MSRFNNPKALASLATGQGMRSAAINSAAHRTNLEESHTIAVRLPNQTVSPVAVARPSSMQGFCFVVLCAYLLSASANDITLHLFHIKAYLSTVTVVLLPLAFLATGSVMRGFQNPIGPWWFAFAIWLSLCAPFSVWRGDTLNLLANYFLRAYVLYFVICACVVTIRQLRAFIRVLAFGAFIVVLTCIAFGSDQGGRFSVAGSPFFSNANELGLQLLLGITYLMFSLFGGSLWAKLVSAIVILASALYLLKTGSRGILIATVAVCALIFLLSQRRWKFLAVAIPAFIVTLIFIPAHTRHRLTFVFATPSAVTIRTEEELAAVESQMQREQLLRESISFAFQHPVFGVGPGEFMVAEAGEKEKEGGSGEWRGTHNSYTQVASEAGLLGFIFHVAAILTCLRMNFRLHRRIVHVKGLEDLAGASLCMFLATAAYAISTFFFHIAYSYYFPILAGVSAACFAIARSELRDRPERRTAIE